MQYKVDDYHDLVGKDFFFTLDGVFVPICQFADTDAGVVEFSAMTDDYSIYFNFESEDYCILRRCGKVEVHVIEDGSLVEKMNEYIRSGNFLKPYPYEIVEGMRAVGKPLFSC